MVFSNAVYDKLKFLAQIVLPALGTLYATVSGLFQWPNTEEVVGTIVAVDLFLGALLSVSAAKYEKSEDAWDGEVRVNTTTDIPQVTFNMNKEPENFENQKQVRFKVVNPS